LPQGGGGGRSGEGSSGGGNGGEDTGGSLGGVGDDVEAGAAMQQGEPHAAAQAVLISMM
jgi:hypothetical protein